MAEDGLDPEEGHIEDSDLVKIVAQLGDQLLPKVLEVTRVLRLDIGDSKSWVRTWASKIVSGDLEAAACLLIALLPNLEKLRIVDDWRFYDSPPFYPTLDRLLNATTDSNYHLTGLNSFKYLSEVGVHGSDDGAGGDFDVGPIFDALPSIRTIKGWSIDGVLESPGQACKARLPVEPDSQITNLEFTKAQSVQSASTAASRRSNHSRSLLMIFTIFALIQPKSSIAGNLVVLWGYCNHSPVEALFTSSSLALLLSTRRNSDVENHSLAVFALSRF